MGGKAMQILLPPVDSDILDDDVGLKPEPQPRLGGRLGLTSGQLYFYGNTFDWTPSPMRLKLPETFYRVIQIH